MPWFQNQAVGLRMLSLEIRLQLLWYPLFQDVAVFLQLWRHIY